MSYMLDTNVLNWLVDEHIKQEDLPAGDYFVTHIQIEELMASAEQERRTRLTLVLVELRPTRVNTESMVMDVSRWDNANWGDGVVFDKLRGILDQLNKGKANNVQDALIGEVCILKGYTLLTADKHLAQAVNQHGGMVQLFTR